LTYARAAMEQPRRRPRITVFGPSPLLTVTIEALPGKRDDIHLHPGGQGVWVARTAGELGAEPILCAMVGGETGAVLQPLLEALPGELRLVRTATSSGCVVVDRRRGERSVVAGHLGDPASLHEIDDLVSIACAEALGSEALAVCSGYPAEVVPDAVYGELVATARANGIPSFVDLSSPSLDGALEAGPDVVKINDWQLAEWLSAPVDGRRWRPAAERLLAAGARAAVVTRAGEPALAVKDGQAWEIVPPRLERGFREGCGDSMLGAMAATTAAGEGWERSLVVGAAAGAACFLRQGLGSAKREVIDELAERVELRALG
jgi:1-phosphofructokinase